MSRTPFAIFLALLTLLSASLPDPVLAKKKEESTHQEKLKEAYDKILEGAKKHEGLLTIWEKEGKLYADLSEEDLKKKFLLFPSISRGISAGRFLGNMQWGPDDVVLVVERRQEKVFLLRKNIRFRSPEESPGATVLETSYSDSVLQELPIAGEDSEEKQLLVRLDLFLLSDWVGIGSSLEDLTGGSFELSDSRSHLRSVKTFPENLEIEVELTFQGGESTLLDSVPDGRSLSLSLNYSLLELKESDYKPRRADDRLGHFLTVWKDLSSTDPEGSFVRVINRWHLEKAHPEAKRSTIKKPIVFHLSKTIPYEYRPVVREAILTWNKAFERIGLLDAIEVRIQGEEANWTPTDVRYHTVAFVGDATFNGIGPSRAHPLTGEILDADVLYNAAALERMLRSYPPLGVREPDKDEERLPLQPGSCDFQKAMQEEMELAALHWMSSQAPVPTTTTTTAEATPTETPRLPRALVMASLRKTIIHEVGHVLGLRHNFKGSSTVPLEKLHDTEFTQKQGLTGSIMDYPAVNLAPPGVPQGEYFSSTLGPYDYWAIEYAYQDFEGDEEAEKKGLAKIAQRAAEPELAYGSDDDKWSGYDRNLDPNCQVYDLSDDPLAFAQQRHRLIQGLWKNLASQVMRTGDRYELLRYATRVLLGKVRGSAVLALPYIGGQFHYRDHRGDPGERPPFVLVAASKQREALNFLLDGIFADSSYPVPEGLLNLLGPDHHSHWGSEGLGKRIDFPLHGMIQRVQDPVLDRLLSPAVLKRLLDAERFAPGDQDVLTAAEYLRTLCDKLFQEFSEAQTASLMRRNLQRQMVHRLSQLLLETSSREATDAPALARFELRRLAKHIEAALQTRSLDPLGVAHAEDLMARIHQTLKAVLFRD